MPKEIIAAPKGQRIALCSEYSFLLVVLLRAAGIEAHAKIENDHVDVIALLDGQRYKLDAVELFIEKTKDTANTDREGIAIHYYNEGTAFFTQGKIEEAAGRFDKTLEFKSDYLPAWRNKGLVLLSQWKVIEAAKCFYQACRLWWKSGSAIIKFQPGTNVSS